jgi:hypothetical protein
MEKGNAYFEFFTIVAEHGTFLESSSRFAKICPSFVSKISWRIERSGQVQGTAVDIFPTHQRASGDFGPVREHPGHRTTKLASALGKGTIISLTSDRAHNTPAGALRLFVSRSSSTCQETSQVQDA